MKAVESRQSISQQTVQNAWCHRRFGWFPEDAAEPLVCQNFNDKIVLTSPCMPYEHHSWQ